MMEATPARTLKELLLRVPADPSHPAIILPDYDPVKGALTVTLGQLRHSIVTLQSALLHNQIVPGDVISIALPSGLQDLVAILAITWARATAAPFNPDFKKEEFEFYMNDIKPKAVIVPRGNLTHPARIAAEGLGIAVWEVTFNQDDLTFSLSITKEGKTLTYPLEHVDGEVEVSPEPDDVAIALHTSGTTSRPKLVPLSHANVTASILHIMNWYELSPSDRSLVVMPLFHVHGLFGAALSSIAAGGVAVVPVRFSATSFWKLVKEHNVTWYSAVPTIHQILLILADKELEEKKKEEPSATSVSFPHLRFIRSCSSPLAPTVFEKLEKVFQAPVLEAYGMTEASHQMASNPLPVGGPRKPGSVGKGTGIEIAILDEKGAPLPQGTKGEVCIKGENVCSGYFNNPAANKANWTNDGWFRTGDQGYLDEEGYLFLTGRIKELINRGGEKISPPEIDEILLESPHVTAAVTFAMPDEKYGEEVHAAVVVKASCLEKSSPEAIEAEVSEFCKKHLSAFKVPKKIHVYADAFPFPTTATGKIPRISVANYYKEGHK